MTILDWFEIQRYRYKYQNNSTYGVLLDFFIIYLTDTSLLVVFVHSAGPTTARFIYYILVFTVL